MLLFFFLRETRGDRQESDALVIGARGQALLARFFRGSLRVPGAAGVELGGLALEGREGGVVGVRGVFFFFFGVGRGGGGRSLLFFFFFVVVALFFVVAAALSIIIAREELAAALLLLQAGLFLLRFRCRLVVGAAPEVGVEGAWCGLVRKEEGKRQVREGIGKEQTAAASI